MIECPLAGERIGRRAKRVPHELVLKTVREIGGFASELDSHNHRVNRLWNNYILLRSRFRYLSHLYINLFSPTAVWLCRWRRLHGLVGAQAAIELVNLGGDNFG